MESRSDYFFFAAGVACALAIVITFKTSFVGYLFEDDDTDEIIGTEYEVLTIEPEISMDLEYEIISDIKGSGFSVGGNKVNNLIDEHQFVVSIFTFPGNTFFVAGTLISRQHVLTGEFIGEYMEQWLIQGVSPPPIVKI